MKHRGKGRASATKRKRERERENKRDGVKVVRSGSLWLTREAFERLSSAQQICKPISDASSIRKAKSA